MNLKDFPGGPVVKTLPSSASGEGSIPGWLLQNHSSKAPILLAHKMCVHFMGWVEEVFAAVSDTLFCGFPEILEGQVALKSDPI